MGFRTMWSRYESECLKTPTPRAVVARRLNAMPSVVDVAREFYHGHAVLKPFLRARMERLLAFVQEDKAEDDHGRDEHASSFPRLLHTFRVLATHVHASDADVRRWARLSAELMADQDVVRLVAQLVDQAGEESPLFRDAVHMSLDWTLSECGARGCPVLPFDETRCKPP